MALFQPPPITRYDVHFNLAGFPVRIHPLFWVMVVLFGLGTNDLVRLVIWVVVVTISILVHELGHAFAMRRYGLDSHIVLHMAGGLTVPESSRWGSGWATVSPSREQEILISLAGPVAGFLLAALVMLGVVIMGGTIVLTRLFGIIPMPTVLMPVEWRIAGLVVMTAIGVNLFWGLINLVPVYPLDGGSIARNVLIGIDPWNGVRKSLWISVVAGAIMAVLGLFLLGSIYMAFLFGYLAFQSYQLLQGRFGSTF
jgi:Zn-dependent protease